MKNEIILYRPNEATEHIEVHIENETVWLNRQQIATLFGRDVKTIGKHINNALKEKLEGIPTVANYAIVDFEGERKMVRGDEIQAILDQYYQITNYVILDDDADMLPGQMGNFVQTSNNINHPDCIDIGYGLTKECTNKAIRILNAK